MALNVQTGTTATLADDLTFTVADSSGTPVATPVTFETASLWPDFPIFGTGGGTSQYPTLPSGYTYTGIAWTVATLTVTRTGQSLNWLAIPVVSISGTLLTQSGEEGGNGYLFYRDPYLSSVNKYIVSPGTFIDTTAAPPSGTNQFGLGQLFAYPEPSASGVLDNGHGDTLATGVQYFGTETTTHSGFELAAQGYAAFFEYGWPHVGTHFQPGVTASETLHYVITIYHGCHVTGPGDYTDGGGGGGTTTDKHALFGLSADRNPFDLTRIVFNVGFNTDPIALRRYYDLEGTPSDVTTTLSGASPSLRCLGDNTHLIAYSDGANAQLARVDDNGSVVQTMASPGAGKLVGKPLIDPSGMGWVPVCLVDTGTGDLVIYRTADTAAFGSWDGSGVTVVAGALAQQPEITGSIADLHFWYHDATGVRCKHSTDGGATWGVLV